MKSKYTSFILFLLIGVCLLFTSNWLVKSKISNHKKNDQLGKINKIADKEIDTKITIWGASTAWVHFNPTLIQKETQKSTYNMGINGTPFMQYKGLLEHFIQYSEQSEYVVLALNINEFEDRGVLATPFLFYHHLDIPSLYSSFSTIDEVTSFKHRYIPFYDIASYDNRLYKRIFYPELNNQEQDGFFPVTREYEEKFVFDSVSVSNQNITAIKEIATLAKATNIKVILSIVPYYFVPNQKVKNLDKFIEEIKNLEKLENVSVFNYLNKPLFQKKEYYYNSLHLIAQGADSLSTYFAQDLINIQE